MMSLKNWAYIFGIVFILIGLAGYVPSLTTDGLLFGMFMVDGTHNLVHLASGVVAILAAMGGAKYAKMYLEAIGVVYGLLTVLGFLTGSALLFMVNTPDNVLHLVIAVTALYIGFTYNPKARMK